MKYFIRTRYFIKSLFSILHELDIGFWNRTPKVAHSVFIAHVCTRVIMSTIVFNPWTSRFPIIASESLLKSEVLALERIKLEYWNINYSFIRAPVICVRVCVSELGKILNALSWILICWNLIFVLHNNVK